MNLNDNEHLSILRELGFKWLAMDDDGEWVVYKTKPISRKRAGWWENLGKGEFINTKLKPIFEGDWHKSLIDLREKL